MFPCTRWLSKLHLHSVNSSTHHATYKRCPKLRPYPPRCCVYALVRMRSTPVAYTASTASTPTHCARHLQRHHLGPTRKRATILPSSIQPLRLRGWQTLPTVRHGKTRGWATSPPMNPCTIRSGTRLAGKSLSCACCCVMSVLLQSKWV